MSDIHRQLKGREVAEVIHNGELVLIRTVCGAEIGIKWVDEHGATIKGRPVIASRGFRMRLHGFRDLVLAKMVGV